MYISSYDMQMYRKWNVNDRYPWERREWGAKVHGTVCTKNIFVFWGKPLVTISDLSGLPASQHQLPVAGFLQVQPNRTLPWATPSPFQGFCFCSGLSCRTEKSVKIHQVSWYRRFCFLASLSLALASWIIVQHRGHALKPLFYRSAFCWTQIKAVYCWFIIFFKSEWVKEWKVDWRATRNLITNGQKTFWIKDPNLLWIRFFYLFLFFIKAMKLRSGSWKNLHKVLSSVWKHHHDSSQF